MAHPNGGSGHTFATRNTFAKAHAFVGTKGVRFHSTTGDKIIAKQGFARDGVTATIVFLGERTRHGSACEACWGFRKDCNGSRIGQCAEALDSVVS